jgi:lipopolysaccharide transport system ATP-binding protein
MSAAITVEGLSKRYRIGELQSAYGTLRDSLAATVRRAARLDHHPHYEEIWALRDVSFEVAEGEVLGVIGRNGAGKSTLLKILTRITTPTSGRAAIRGRVGSLLEVGTGFHPELTGRENVYLNGSVLGMKRREITRKFPEIVEFAGVEKFIDTPVKRYSSGMSVRLAFAVAAHLEPEILLVDEVLAVGDAEFQRRCLGRMEDFSESGRTVLFVSHNMQTLAQLCDRTILLDQGRIERDGPSPEVVAYYLQTQQGTASVQVWPDLATAPGDDLVRLRSVRVIQEGEVAPTVDVRRPIGIEIAFTVLRYGVPVFPKLKVLDRQGDLAFNALDTSPRWNAPAEPGDYVATAWIPPNLLNEGLAGVAVAVCSASVLKLHHHTGTSAPLSFHVHDPGEGDSARGSYAGQFRGAVRPLLDWTVEEGELPT